MFHVPTVTVRKTTERPETIDCGSNMLSGLNGDQIVNCVKVMVNQSNRWSYPEGYDHPDVSDKVIKVILGGLNSV